MSDQDDFPYAPDHWQRWQMDPFEFPADHPNALKTTPAEADMAALLAEVDELKELAQQQGQLEGYAIGHQQGSEAGRTQGFAQGFDEGHAKGSSDGYGQGHKEGYEKGAAKAQTEATRLAELATNSGSSFNNLHEDLGQALLALAVDVAQHVLQTELTQYPEHLIPLLKKALKDIDQKDQAVTLLLHPDDLLLVEQHLSEDIKHNAWRLKADKNIRAGGVEITSALGHIDATLETRWRRALARLGPCLASSDKNAL